MNAFQGKHRFSDYRITEQDLADVIRGADMLQESGIYDPELIQTIRLTTFDCEYFYVVTHGTHRSAEGIVVDDASASGEIGELLSRVQSQSEHGFKIYRIPHDGAVGSSEEDYEAGAAGFFEKSKSIIDATTFGVVTRPHIWLPIIEKIYPCPHIPPATPYHEVQQGRWDYWQDIFFHEVGHNEQHHCMEIDYDEVGIGGSAEFEAQIRGYIENTHVFSPALAQSLLRHIDGNALSEVYAQMMDRQGARYLESCGVYPKGRLAHRLEALHQRLEAGFEAMVKERGSEEFNLLGLKENERGVFKCHPAGVMWVSILEEQIPDFNQRRNFVQTYLRSRFAEKASVAVPVQREQIELQPLNDQEHQRLSALVEKSGIFPKWYKQMIMQNVGKQHVEYLLSGGVDELKDHCWHLSTFTRISPQPTPELEELAKNQLQHRGNARYLLRMMIQDQIPDVEQRIAFLQSLIDPASHQQDRERPLVAHEVAISTHESKVVKDRASL